MASDLLLAATIAVCSYAYSLTKAATFDVRTILHKQLDDTITIYEKVKSYMMNKGYSIHYGKGFLLCN